MSDRPAKDAERFAQQVLNASLNGIYIHDLIRGRNTFINDRYTQLTGYTLKDLDAMDRDRFLELFHPQDRKRVSDHIRKVASDREEVSKIEYRFRTKDGRWIWCLSRDRVFDRLPDGTVSRFIGTFLDISDQKRRAQELAKHRELLQGLFDNIPVLLVMWDPKLKRFTLNRRAEAVLGWTTEDANRGDFMSKVYPEADYRKQVADYMQSLVPGWREWTVATKNGERILIDWANIRLTDETMVGIGVDLRERKASEKALRESERRLRKVMDNMVAMIGLTTPEGILVEANRTSLEAANLQPEDVIGKPFEECYWWAWSSEVQKRLRAAIEAAAAGRISRYDEDIRIGEGEFRTIDFMLSPLFDSTGRIVYLIPSATDITDRKQAEEKVQEINRELEKRVISRTAQIEAQYEKLEKLNFQLKQMAQHTIKAMENDRRALSKEVHDSIGGNLAAIKMLLEHQMAGAAAPASEAFMPLEKIIGHLADTIKESKRISYQMRSLSLDDFGLKAAVSENIRKFLQFYPSIDVQFRFEIADADLPDELVTVVYRVVQEALNNVGKHSGARSVRIAFTESADVYRLKIEDDGDGFDITRTLDSERPLQGYGMLSMQERIEICKGTFQVASEPGKGTTLLAVIPRNSL